MIEEQHIKHSLTIDDLQHVAMSGGASFSAAGEMLVYVTTRVVLEENAHKDYISIIDILTNQEITAWEGSGPQWSPLANEIAYLAGYNGLDYIWIYSLDEDVRRPLAPVYESHYFMG